MFFSDFYSVFLLLPPQMRGKSLIVLNHWSNPANAGSGLLCYIMFSFYPHRHYSNYFSHFQHFIVFFWILRGMFLLIRSIGRVAAVFFRRKNPTDFLLRKSMGFYQHLFS